jgi:hypothetical protein
MTLFKVRLTAPDDRCLLAEVMRTIDEHGAERSITGCETTRYFAAAGDKVSFAMSPGDELDVAEFTESYSSLDELVKKETLKRDAEVDPVMPELRVVCGEELH